MKKTKEIPSLADNYRETTYPVTVNPDTNKVEVDVPDGATVLGFAVKDKVLVVEVVEEIVEVVEDEDEILDEEELDPSLDVVDFINNNK
jgi:hypothetical protein